MQILPDFSKQHILVIGDLMLDRYWHGGTHRISPEAPVPVVRVQEAEERPGGAANVALNIAALGAKVSLIGICGHDEDGALLKNKCAAANVHCKFIEDKLSKTISKLRIVSLQQQLIRLDFEVEFSKEACDEILQIAPEFLQQVDAVIFSDYGKGTLNRSRELIALANAKGIPVFVDPKGRDFDLYRGATFITPNRKEFEEVMGVCKSDEMLSQQGKQLLTNYQINNLLITRGAQGMTFISDTAQEYYLPAVAREVYDVTGAGDTVISMLALAIAAGCDKESAMMLANLAASIVVGKLGTATVNITELRRAYFSHRMPNDGVLTQEQLQFIVADAKAHGEKIVMTNGCFDILHVGHISYLANAKALGDRLIIAVNSDDSVKKLKGPTRPVNSLENRMAVLAALSMVDWVVPFTEETPAKLIGEILPDVLVKGGDYQDPTKIAGYDSVIKNGGSVKILNFVEGQSSSNIIKKLNGEEIS